MDSKMEETTAERPQWLVDLENRKRKPRLAHEAGAGAPCTICNSSCPGLDLHFWRKICKICKCSRDDHQVDDDDFPQFDLLFGPSAKLKKKSTLLRIPGKKQCEGESVFEWVPPDTSEELAVDYMKALPLEKLPITGSSGALLRKQLLQKQLPLHDFDHEACSSLSEEEKQEFEKYLENLKKYVGQGKVTKVLGARPFDKSLMTPANATDVQRFSPQRKPQVPSVSAVPTLRTPSSFVKTLPYSKKTLSSENRQKFSNGLKITSGTECSKTMGIPHKSVQPSCVPVCNAITSEVPHCQPEIYETCECKEKHSCEQLADYATPCCNSAMCRSVPCTAKLASSETVEEVTKMHISPLARTEKLTMEDAENMLADALLPPSAIRSRDIIGSTLDKQGLMYIRDKLSSKYSVQEAPKEVHANTVSPIELNSRSKDRPINAALNAISPARYRSILSDDREDLQETKNADKANYTKSKISTVTNVPTNIIHSESLQKQVFPHEAIEGQSDGEKDVNASEIHRMNDAMKGLTIESPKAQNCDKCRGEIHVGDVVVNVEKAKNAVWHPGCFACSVCEELLVDLVYFYYKNKLYCARDLATLLGIPRCFACDELIFVREYTVAEGHNYHVKHFCCWDCDVPLAGQRYISENDRPLCLPCYQKTYAQTCNTCNFVIAADQQGVAIKNLNFHANEQCFCCYTCKKNLLNNRFAIKEEKLFCSKECISKYFSKNSST